LALVFMGLKVPDDHAVFPYLNHVGSIHKPFNGKLILGIHTLEISKGFRSVQSGRVLTPLTAQGDGVKFKFCVRVFLESLEMLEKGAQGMIAKLRFAPAGTEGVNE